MILLLAMVSAAAEYRFDEEEPEVKDRVARISLVKGDVQIKRSDNDQWERVVLNLPIVEGDELTTGPDSRFEIQFGAYSHLRVAERSTLKITSLKDGLVAVSLPEGNLSVTLVRFDADREAFEIDAPLTTIALLKAGRYRVDAGPAGYEAVRISIPEQGEARVYSNNSGFTLHEGRSTRIFVSGKYLGEFENSDAAQYVDTFDRWALDRDEFIAKRQGQSYYGKYYDTDIYGADDLSDNGEWINTPEYGYVWRPYRNTIAGYADWSPYRYGTWRWVPGYGWAWVNDEPWGWATYHHGRWVWYNSGWYWSPYGYYRQYRSWWYPALVILRVINRNVCWYPLPYNYAYYNYNWNYHRRRRGDDDRRNNNVRPAVQPTPRPGPYEPQRNVVVIPPDTSVVAVSIDDFGKGRSANTKIPRELGRTIIARDPNQQDDSALPIMRDIGSKVKDDIRAVKPQEPARAIPITVGAAQRGGGDEPMDKKLQNRIIYGNRPVVTPRPSDDGDTGQPSDRKAVPVTGAVGRPATRTDDDGGTKEPQRVTVTTPNDDSPPVRSVPRNDPPQRQEPKEPTRRDTPVISIPKRSEPPPQRSEPQKEPQRRSDPPPQKSEPPKTEPAKQPEPRKTRDN
jgi:hypothetical protein